MILERLASKKSKNDLVDASGAHFKVAQGSKSGGRVAAQAIYDNGEAQVGNSGNRFVRRLVDATCGRKRRVTATTAASGGISNFEVSPRGVY